MTISKIDVDQVPKKEILGNIFFFRTLSYILPGMRTLLLLRTSGFVCNRVGVRVAHDLRFGTIGSRAFASKPYYVTTPIFYVNAAPHIGHLYSMILADNIKRWREFYDKRPALMCTGTDEHGLKVQQAALKAGEEPKPFVDKSALNFKELADYGYISYDRFIRTTDPDHIETAQKVWTLLADKGYIYKGQHSGWYCVSDETFYPDTQVEKSTDESGAEIMISKETGKKVEWTSEENYFFALSKFQRPLLDHLKSHEKFIVPFKWHEFVIREIESGLHDLSISRPKSRCSWGVPVPGDDTQIMYVWLEALVNYVTFSGRLSVSNGSSNPWPADVHIVGKDIVRFHTIYWPAFLMAAGLELPKTVVVHSHWTMDGSKMSKSVGNVVDPFKAMAAYRRDNVKFFLLHDGHLDHDTPYSSDRLIERCNTLLVNKVGNLILRVCGPKFDLPASLASTLVPEKFQDRHDELVARIDSLVSEINADMGEFSTSRALGKVIDLATVGNLFIQSAEPWTYNPESAHRKCIVKDAAEVARVCAISLQPFLPEIASECLDRLNVEASRRTVDYARYGADLDFGVGSNRKGGLPLIKL